MPDAITRLDLLLPSPDTPAPAITRHEARPASLLSPPAQCVIEPHRVGHEGPWWADVRAIEADGTLGLVVHSTNFVGTREEAVAVARAWIMRE